MRTASATAMTATTALAATTRPVAGLSEDADGEHGDGDEGDERESDTTPWCHRSGVITGGRPGA